MSTGGIEAAVKRAVVAIDSKYLPEQLSADLNVLIRAAVCWNELNKRRIAVGPKPASVFGVRLDNQSFMRIKP